MQKVKSTGLEDQHNVSTHFKSEIVRINVRAHNFTLRKHAYSNILKILPPKNENFSVKNSDIFHISAQNVDCVHSLEPPRRGGSN